MRRIAQLSFIFVRSGSDGNEGAATADIQCDILWFW